MDEVGRAMFIQRDRDRAAHQTAEERRDPFRTVFAPEQNAITLAYPARLKLAGKLKGSPDESGI